MKLAITAVAILLASPVLAQTPGFEKMVTEYAPTAKSIAFLEAWLARHQIVSLPAGFPPPQAPVTAPPLATNSPVEKWNPRPLP